MAHPAIACRGMVKAYGGAIVVNGVDVDIRPGEIHALIGANGAGKSTLLGMMSGRVVPTAGSITVSGKPFEGGHPRRAIQAGISAIYQELAVLPHLSALDNVFVGQHYRRGPVLQRGAIRKRFGELCGRLGVHIDPNRIVRTLPVATAQILEIMRALQADAKVLLFDEPTAALSEREREFLLRLLRDLRSEGRAIVFVSHDLDEVLDISDTITVMRDSRKVAEGPIHRWTKSSMVAAMTGEMEAPSGRARSSSVGDVVLEVEGLRLPGAVEDISFEVRRGEILGFVGLVGSGRTSILRSLAGAEPTASGSLTINGRTVPWPRSVRRALLKYDIALVPEDRKNQGLVLNMSIPDNLTMSNFRRVSQFGLVRPRLQQQAADAILRSLDFSHKHRSVSVGSLSGGNQQKVVLGKWLYRNPSVLLIDEPTRGIDIAAKAEVMNAIGRLASQGKAVIMTSSEIEDVLENSDRILVLHEGRIVAQFDLATATPTLHEILHIAFGVDHAA